MASVVTPLDQPSNYKDSQARVDRLRQNDLLQKSTTLYVSSCSTCICFTPYTVVPCILQIGNLSFYTTEEQIHDMFSKCANPEDGGGVKRIIMGLDRHTRYVGPLLPLIMPDLGTPLIQDTMRFLFCGVLYAGGGTREHAIYIRHQIGRADNSL